MLRLALLLALPAGLFAADTLRGKLLVASPAERDPDFTHTIVLVLSSGDAGAAGIILNQPTIVPLRSLFPGLKSPAAAAAHVYKGGPLRMGINALTKSAAKPERASLVFGDVYLISDKAALESALARTPIQFIRLYVGLCGWGPGQLQDELRRRVWNARAPQSGILFDPHPDSSWDRIAGH